MKTMLAEEKWDKEANWRPMHWYIQGFEDYVYWMNLGLVVVFDTSTHAVRKRK